MSEGKDRHVAVVGSRDFPDLARVRRFVTALAAKYPRTVVVSGGARGVDRAAEETAEACALRWYSFRPRKTSDGYEVVIVSNDGLEPQRASHSETYPTFGKAAFARNRFIVQHSQEVVAFTIGSNGTANTLDIARELGVPFHVYEPDSDRAPAVATQKGSPQGRFLNEP